jgi:hypothetical protein
MPRPAISVAACSCSIYGPASWQVFRRRDGDGFENAIVRVRTEQVKAVDTAAYLVSRLTEEEKPWLLDGEQAFWPGILRTVPKRFSRTPGVADTVRRLGIPASDSPTVRLVSAIGLRRAAAQHSDPAAVLIKILDCLDAGRGDRTPGS